jgi:hypothetical protein
VERENTLNTFTIGNLADGKRLVDTAATHGDDETCENLDTLFSAFDDAAMDFDGVADVEWRKIFLELLLLDFFDDVHDLGCGKVFD